MLVISRKKSEKIFIADNIEITILEVGQHRVRVGIQAPKEIKIDTRFKSSAQETPADKVKPFLPAAVGMSTKG